MPKFHLSLLTNCDFKCPFCAKSPLPSNKKFYTFKEALALIIKKKKEGYNEISFDGGEPTLIPWLDKLIYASFKEGYREVFLLTNASPLSDENKVKSLKKAISGHKKNFSISISLHSHKLKVAERLSATSGSFQRTMLGIKNLKKNGFSFIIYHLITTLNYRLLPDFASFIIQKKYPLESITFSYLFPAGHIKNIKKLYPKLSLVQPYFIKAVSKLEKAGFKVRLSSCGLIPICLLRGYEKLYIRTFINDARKAYTTDIFKSEEFPYFTKSFNQLNRIKTKKCSLCILNPVCYGMWKFYIDLYGDDELKPFDNTYFAKLSSKKSAANLHLKNINDYNEPLYAAFMNLLKLRLEGYDSVRISGLNIYEEQKKRLMDFAREIKLTRVEII